MEGPNQKKMQMIVESQPSEKKHFLKKEITTQMLRPIMEGFGKVAVIRPVVKDECKKEAQLKWDQDRKAVVSRYA